MYITTLTDNPASLRSHLKLTVSLVKMLLIRFLFVSNNCLDGIKRISDNSKYNDIKGGNCHILIPCLPAKFPAPALCNELLPLTSDKTVHHSFPKPNIAKPSLKLLTKHSEDGRKTSKMGCRLINNNAP